MDDFALERVLARLEDELAAHTRAWAERGAAPAAPPALTDAGVRRVLERAIGDAEHAARVAPYLAACRLAAIEADAAVARARAAAPSWSGLAALSAARAAAAAGQGAGLLELLREAHGVGELPAPGAIPPAAAGFRDEGDLPAIGEASVLRAARAIAERNGARDLGGLRVAIGDEARCFVITPGRDVRVRVRAGASVARWSEALHELGHALLGLAPGPRPRRALDEAAAATAARLLERADFAAAAFGAGDAIAARVAAIARAGRARQTAQRAHLAAYEARVLAGESLAPPDLDAALPHPPLALWHDPGAQLAYAAADHSADAIDGLLA